MGIIFNRIDEKLDAQVRAGELYDSAAQAWCDCLADIRCSESEKTGALAMFRAAYDTFKDVCNANVLDFMPEKYK